MEIAGCEPDLILITEVIPKAQSRPLSLALLKIEGYSIYLNFDPSKQNLGKQGLRGLCIYVRDGIQCLPSQVLHSENIETLFLRIPLHGNDSLLLGVLNRSPSTCQEASTHQVCHVLKQVSRSSSSHIVLAGDFNYPGIDWDKLCCRFSQSHPTHMFLEAIDDCFFTQHIKKPTRYMLGSEPSILDLILSNEEGMINGVEYHSSLGSSDHLVIQFGIVCYTAPHPKECKSKPAFYKADFQRLRHQASLLSWGQVEALELPQAYEFFQQHVNDLVTSFIPKSKPGRSKNLYMTRAALRLRKRKRVHWAEFMRSRSSLDYSRYKRSANQLRTETRRLRKDFEARLADELKSNPKAFWRYVNTRMKTKVGIDALECENGSILSSPQDKAEILNRFFTSVFVDEDLITVPSLMKRATEELPDFTITTAEVLEKLRGLKVTGAPGPDGLHPRVLYELAPHIAQTLATIFNKSLVASQLPKSWCQATVIPVLKRGSRHQPSNYRPISLTSIPCKVMESIIRDKIMHHLDTNDLLSPHQHGFRPSRSCTTQLLEVLDAWTQAVDRGEATDVIYLDFQKAFDSVPHARLLEKLKSYGISGSVLRWIQAFLSDRTQQVLVEGERSRWSAVTSGVPQGSVLGPLLFLLYINDMPDFVQTSVKLFADDSKLYGPVDSPCSRQRLQEDIQHLEEWSAAWQLPFNVKKCEVLHIGSTNPGYEYTMFGSSLAASKEVRDLGITIDGSLRFHSQAAAAAAKANQVLGIIRRSFMNLTKTSLPLLFKSMVRPHLEFSNTIWGPMSRGDQKLVEKVQRRATKLVPEIRCKPYMERLRDLRLPSLTYRRARGDMILIYQILHGLVDVDQDLLLLSSNRHTRGHQYKLSIERARTLPRRHFLSVRAANRWNGLPPDVVSAPTLSTFKSRLDTHWSDIHYISVFDDQV